MNVTPFDPLTSWDPGLYGKLFTEFDGETKYLGSNIPSSNYSQMQTQLSNFSWTNTLPVYYNSCPWPVRYINSGNPDPTQILGINTSGNSNAYNCS
jgi:hypothetical protein